MLRVHKLIVCVLLVGCGSEDDFELWDSMGVDRSPIVGGEVTNGFPTVGELYSGNTGCTGTLISKRDVLTARHCINSSSGKFVLGGRRLDWVRGHKHPDRDLGLVNLGSAVNGIRPSPLGTSPVRIGQKITMVGYGLIGYEGQSNKGKKYVGVNKISEFNEHRFGYEGKPNICSGDSGGPSFTGDKVVGVHFAGRGGSGSLFCSDLSWDRRVDPFVGWIRSKMVAGGGGDPGPGPDPDPDPGPDPDPDPGTCGGGKRMVKVVIRTDNRGGEIAWVFRKKGGQTLMQGQGLRSNQTHTKQQCVPKGAYVFRIKDRGKNGLCCQYGRGYYRVFVDSKRVANGNRFSQMASHPIQVR